MSNQHHNEHNHEVHGSTKHYIIGFVLSIILTIIPFGMVMSGSKGTGVMAVIGITAVAQVLIQLIYFLHMNSSPEQRWNVIAFTYTILTIAALLIGSVWIMNYLHSNMMLY
ncbi:cytochrome o ubiquinol oxidase subunit IV [Moraxella sp. ZY210820]|uniref:cytochrome o ubiquinol oxidase subunit IV n=1 Tax=unclassified Moraxella TaxID=2685852 RepID=UPI0027320607|nr:cytochrome o ubiquinol oxidase subunit IV [Moraxella sp. ZY210820]WLF84664.1 cytochrome o ubiquinol oxidase subunit IV [Moraxella sp. ZY210820]